MTVFGQTTARAVAAAVFSVAFAACGGGSDSISTAPIVSTSPPPVVVTQPPEVVTGVALPSTVAVVTATNAN